MQGTYLTWIGSDVGMPFLTVIITVAISQCNTHGYQILIIWLLTNNNYNNTFHLYSSISTLTIIKGDHSPNIPTIRKENNLIRRENSDLCLTFCLFHRQSILPKPVSS